MRVFTKLNLKDQRDILIVQAPASFEPEVAALEGVTVRRQVPRSGAVTFALAFVTTLDEVERLSRAIAARAEGDAIVWFAYPKQSSKRYTCSFNRDTGWAALGALGFEVVRSVAIDDDWTALRFRRVEFIKTLRRDPARAMTAAAKARSR